MLLPNRLLRRYVTHALVMGMVFLFGLFLFYGRVHAAAMYLSPSSGTHTVGSSFSVDVYVSSEDQAMNAVSANITFPNDKLAVASTSRSGSIINFWAQEPSVGLSSISFEGVVFNPGYTGGAGRILRITFIARAEGNAPVSFSSGAVLANDGQGSNITSSLLNGNYYIDRVVNLPGAPTISSSTHPDQEAWYQNRNPEFAWMLPADVDQIRVAFNDNASSPPSTLHNPPISERKYEEIDDGIWYFHLQFHNSDGWGAIGRYKVQIDNSAPTEFNINEIQRDDSTEPSAVFEFDVTETPSSVAYYEIKIDGGEWEKWEPEDGAKQYTTSALKPGEHRMFVRVYDQAGNYLETSSTFWISAIDPPVFLDWDSEQLIDKYFVLKGSSYDNATVKIWLQKKGEVERLYIIEAEEDGSFTFVSEQRLPEGEYELWASAVDTRGAESLQTDKINLSVHQPPLFYIPFERNSLMYLLLLLVLILLVVIFVILWHYWHEHMEKELDEMKPEEKPKKTTVKRKTTKKTK